MLCVSGNEIKEPVLKNSAHMINIIGEEIEDWWDKNNTEKVKIHLYNKKEAKKGRKMGHITELFNKEKIF